AHPPRRRSVPDAQRQRLPLDLQAVPVLLEGAELPAEYRAVELASSGGVADLQAEEDRVAVGAGARAGCFGVGRHGSSFGKGEPDPLPQPGREGRVGRQGNERAAQRFHRVTHRRRSFPRRRGGTPRGPARSTFPWRSWSGRAPWLPAARTG